MINISLLFNNRPKLVSYLCMVCAFVAFCSGQVYAQGSNGGYSEAYLLRDVGARSVAMAGAYTAIANDPATIFYNPAGLGFFSTNSQVVSSVSSLGMGRSQTVLAWGQQLSEGLGIGFGFNGFMSGNFTARDVMGNKKGTYSDFQYSFSGGAAYSLEFASLGASLKYLTNNLRGSETEAQGVALDVGAKFNIMDMFSFGVSVQNISGMMFWNTAGSDIETIPYVIRAGVAMEYGLNATEYTSRSTVDGSPETINEPATRYLLFGVDAVMSQHDVCPSLVVGLEAVVHELVVFRGGIDVYGDKEGKAKMFPMNHWGAGVSLRPELDAIFGTLPFKTHIDYSISSEYAAESKAAHHVSLVFQF